MRSEDMRLTAGQFAALHHINKRTLHYYDAIGLFSPAHVGENGYRYYTYLQSGALEMILTMRELGMSIEEIGGYMKNRSETAFGSMLADKTAEIEEHIRSLKEIRRLLATKQQQLCFCRQLDPARIEQVECAEEYLVLSRSITGAYDENDFAVFMEHENALRGHRLFNKSYGSMIAADKIASQNFDEYDSFFTKVERRARKTGVFVKEKGRYLRAFCKGSWDNIPATYLRILRYAETQGLSLRGYAYEEGLNEMAIASMDEYITQITILCE